MAVDVFTKTVIDCPREAVAKFAADPSNAPRWYMIIKSVEWKTPPPLAVGSEVAFVAYFLGRRMAYTYKVVEFEPSERLVMATAEGPFPMETSYSWLFDRGSADRNDLEQSRESLWVWQDTVTVHGVIDAKS